MLDAARDLISSFETDLTGSYYAEELDQDVAFDVVVTVELVPRK